MTDVKLNAGAIDRMRKCAQHGVKTVLSLTLHYPPFLSAGTRQFVPLTRPRLCHPRRLYARF